MTSRLRRAFRFGVQLGATATGGTWADQARRAEQLGYDVVAVGDRLTGAGFAFGPALAAAAAATTRLRIGTLVLVNDYRHPMLVAKEAATLDVLSAGRFELGLGAGWMADDFARSGIPFDPPAIRVARFIEGTQAIKRLLAGEPVTVAGQYYAITAAMTTPAPIQRPHPPLLIGAAGHRMLAFAAREADIVSLLPRIQPDGRPRWADLTVAGMAEKIAWLRQAAPERLADIEIHTLIQRVAITTAWRGEATPIAHRWGVDPEAVRSSPVMALGTIAQIVDNLREQRSRLGLSYFSVRAEQLEAFAPIAARLVGH